MSSTLSFETGKTTLYTLGTDISWARLEPSGEWSVFRWRKWCNQRRPGVPIAQPCACLTVCDRINSTLPVIPCLFWLFITPAGGIWCVVPGVGEGLWGCSSSFWECCLTFVSLPNFLQQRSTTKHMKRYKFNWYNLVTFPRWIFHSKPPNFQLEELIHNIRHTNFCIESCFVEGNVPASKNVHSHAKRLKIKLCLVFQIEWGVHETPLQFYICTTEKQNHFASQDIMPWIFYYTTVLIVIL